MVDSWYMKWPYLSSALKLGFHTIGQVRRDTALYDMPVNTEEKAGRESMGKNLRRKLLPACRNTADEVFLYGKWQWVRYRSAVCLAKFMNGHRSGRYGCSLKMKTAS